MSTCTTHQLPPFTPHAAPVVVDPPPRSDSPPPGLTHDNGTDSASTLHGDHTPASEQQQPPAADE